MKTKIMYVGVNEQSKNKVTIATEVVGDELKVAFAVCSKNDTFKKAMGRNIALGRLAKEGKYFVTKFTGKSEIDIERLLKVELDKTVKDAIFPETMRNCYFYVWSNRLWYTNDDNQYDAEKLLMKDIDRA